MKHRKLYPNESLECPDVCDSTCPCYPYSDTYYVPPPLPLPPPGPPSSTKQGPNILPYVVIIASLLGITLIIISYYLIVFKNCFGWIRPRPRHQRGAEENFLDEDHEPEIDHPIWYIRTIGLQPSIINSITVFKYKKGDSLIEGTDCSVCLSEFRDDEILRLLPKCSHAFHIPCIDTWLRSHTNCPVCRAGIVVNGVSTPVARNEDNQVEITVVNHPENEGEDDENSVGLEDEFESQIPQDSIDVQGETTKVGLDFDDSDETNPGKDEIQQLKRSISADSLVNLPIDFGKSPFDHRGDGQIRENPEQNGLKTRMNQRYDDAVIGQSSHWRDCPVKRSFSYSGRSFLSRNSRSSNSILPL